MRSNRIRLLLSMLLISRSKDYGRYLCSIDILPFPYLFDLQLPPLASNIVFFFIIHQGAVFFIFFFLLFSLPSSVLQWHHEGGNFFSEYDRSNWLFYVGFYLEVFKNLFISNFLWGFYLRHSFPAPHFKALQIFPLQFS